MKKLAKSCVIQFLTLSFIGCNLAPGAYVNAEEYEVDSGEHALIEAIQDFKRIHPEYVVPDTVQLVDGHTPNKAMDYWYYVYFYFPDEKQILLTWTRPRDEDHTTFALVRLNQGLTLGHWKSINRDFSRSENAELKKKFEERILNPIKEKL